MAPRRYGAEDARNHLPELLERAHHGKPTLITRRGRPYAVLMPVEQAQAGRRRTSILSLARTGAGLWGSDSTRIIAAMRDEWP
jgi:prevent-host-death family protein